MHENLTYLSNCWRPKYVFVLLNNTPEWNISYEKNHILLWQMRFTYVYFLNFFLINILCINSGKPPLERAGGMFTAIRYHLLCICAFPFLPVSLSFNIVQLSSAATICLQWQAETQPVLYSRVWSLSLFCTSLSLCYWDASISRNNYLSLYILD